MVNPYVPWASEDAQWHGQSGPKMCDTAVAVTTTTLTGDDLTGAVTTVAAAFVTEAVPTVVIAADATFEVDFSTIVVADFTAEFKTAMAASLGFGDVVVDGVVEGSVIVNWHVLAPTSVATEAASIVVSATPPTVGAVAATIGTPTVTEGPPTTLAGDAAVSTVEDNSVDCVGTWACGADCTAVFTTTTAQNGLGAACPADDASPCDASPCATPAETPAETPAATAPPAPPPASSAATAAVTVAMVVAVVAPWL
jgi:hypothetical protein